MLLTMTNGVITLYYQNCPIGQWLVNRDEIWVCPLSFHKSSKLHRNRSVLTLGPLRAKPEVLDIPGQSFHHDSGNEWRIPRPKRADFTFPLQDCLQNTGGKCALIRGHIFPLLYPLAQPGGWFP